ncbi:hypothetical protein RI367_000180 [Sorochytrium milnesiophthora]
MANGTTTPTDATNIVGTGAGSGNGVDADDRGHSSADMDGLAYGQSSLSGQRRREVIQLMTQEMRALGYIAAAKALEDESGYSLEQPEVTRYRRAILSGDWDTAGELLDRLAVEGGNRSIIRFLTYEQKYLELLEARDLTGALAVLRTELSTLDHDPPRLHKLSSFIMCPTAESLKEHADWDGAAGQSRYLLLQNVQKYISASVMIAERRLEQLLDQALELQRDRCVYHNSDMHDATLFEDHVCSAHNLPITLLHVFENHEDEVWYVAFSHNGKYLASSSKDGRTIVWNVETFKVSTILRGHQDAVAFAAWSPDDSRILTCGNDKRLKMWDAARGVELLNLHAHTSSVTACAWLPNGKTFVSGSVDKSLILWSIDGRMLHKWTGARVADLCISRDGKRLVVATQDMMFKIYDMDSLQEIGQIPEEGPITSVTISADGKYIICNTSSQEVHLWDLEKQRLLKKYLGQQQGKFVIRSTLGGYNESFLVSGNSKAYMWHRATGKLVHVLEGHQATVNSVAWNPVRHNLLATSSDDKTVRLWASRSYSDSKPPPATEARATSTPEALSPMANASAFMF